MEHHSQTDSLADQRNVLNAQLRELYGRVVYSHKVHEKEADILLARLSKVKLAQIVLPAISTTGFASILFGTEWLGSLVGTLCSVVLLALNLYTRSDDLGAQAQEHRDAAASIWPIRENYLSLITDLALGNPLPDIQEKRDALLDELAEVYNNSPSTTERAYKKAQKALNLQGEMTFSADEVDAFLPHTLKGTGDDYKFR